MRREPRPMPFAWSVAPVLLLCAASTLRAQDTLTYGARSQAMGGTGVASAIDATAVNNNPALFGFMDRTDFQFPLASVDARLYGDPIKEIDDILDVYDGLPSQFGVSDLEGLVDLLSNTTDAQQRQLARQVLLGLFLYDVQDLDQPEQGLTGRIVTGPTFRYKHWAIGLLAAGDAALDTVVDLQTGLSLGPAGFDPIVPLADVNTAACTADPWCDGFAQTLAGRTAGAAFPLAPEQARQLVLDSDPGRLQADPRAQSALQAMVDQTAAGSGATLQDNQSGAVTTGIALGQVAFGYGHTVGIPQLAVGGTARVYYGVTYRQGVVVADLQDTDELLNRLRNQDTRRTSDVGLDVGLLYRPVPSLGIGLVGHNVNEPSFAFVDGGREYVFPASYQIGAAYSPKRWFTIAAEYDLNEVESSVLGGVGYRYGRLGVELVAGGVVAFRFGAFENLALENGGLVFTGGLGFRIGRFEIALAGTLSDREVEVAYDDGTRDTFPSSAGVTFQLGWNSHGRGKKPAGGVPAQGPQHPSGGGT